MKDGIFRIKVSVRLSLRGETIGKGIAQDRRSQGEKAQAASSKYEASAFTAAAKSGTPRALGRHSSASSPVSKATDRPVPETDRARVRPG